MMDGPSLAGTLDLAAGSTPVQVLATNPYSLVVAFPDGAPADAAAFSRLTLQLDGRELSLGRGRFEAHPPHPYRRAGDAPRPPGDGMLVFLGEVYDFSALLKSGTVLDLGQVVAQLPLLINRRVGIRPAFRDYTAALVYDLQAYRSIFDAIDRQLIAEKPSVTGEVHRLVQAGEYGRFRDFYQRQTDRLEELVAAFGPAEHEQHGFYFRKQVWDLILCSEFLARTNLKPRGYAGDSRMMDLLYANQFTGATIFARFMHKFPVEQPAAQAVRNRRALIAGRIDELRQRLPARPFKIFSVACGPARELADLIRTPQDAEDLAVTLLDQDPEALQEAVASAAQAGGAVGRTLSVTALQESIRTVLRHPDLPAALGRHHYIYACGLFDYLTPPVARAVAQRLYDLLLPGGELLIGNYHVGNPTRVYMEYWADWVLYYRSEQDMLAMTENLPGAQADVIFEETGCQMFLRIGKH